MKKEILNLIKSEEGTLVINKYFKLKRFKKNILGDEADRLQLEGSILHHYDVCVEIKSREFPEIKEEVLIAIDKAMNEAKEKMLKDFSNGYLYGGN